MNLEKKMGEIKYKPENEHPSLVFTNYDLSTRYSVIPENFSLVPKLVKKKKKKKSRVLSRLPEKVFMFRL